MQRQIIIGGKKIDYTIRSSRRTRHLRLAIYLDGRLSVSRPTSVSLKFVQDFLLAKANWIIAKLSYYKSWPPALISGRVLSNKDYLKRKEAARSLINSRLIHFNQFYNFSYSSFSVRNQRTRWGSCSRRGRLNFNYRLLDLPPEVADYVIVHELCHLKEFNHSIRFWKLVSESLPDYQNYRARLRQKIV